MASSWAYQTKLFPKLFATVIYIVLLFVSFGTIFTQLMIFAKGSWKWDALILSSFLNFYFSTVPYHLNISFICKTGWIVGSLKYEFGQGIWCGIIFCGCGSIGVATAASPSIHKIKLFILSNIAAIISSFTLAFLGFSNIDNLRYKLANIPLEGHPYSTNHENDDIRILLQLIVVQIVIGIIVVSLILFSLMGIILISFARSRMDYYIQRKEVVWV